MAVMPFADHCSPMERGLSCAVTIPAQVRCFIQVQGSNHLATWRFSPVDSVPCSLVAHSSRSSRSPWRHHTRPEQAVPLFKKRFHLRGIRSALGMHLPPFSPSQARGDSSS
jgi:hypothetical protein